MIELVRQLKLRKDFKSESGTVHGSPVFVKGNERTVLRVNEEINQNGAEIIEEIVKSGKSTYLKNEFFEWMKAIILAVVLALIIRNFIFTVVRVDGQSMEPTLQHNDRMIVWRLCYQPKAGDIVIFNPPGYPKKIYWVKRVIATEGQHVEIDYNTNSVYVDGEKLDEPYLGEPMLAQSTITKVDVPEDFVFVMGDNRNHSTDGRVIGPVHKDNIIGKAVVRFWPINKFSAF